MLYLYPDDMLNSETNFLANYIFNQLRETHKESVLSINLPSPIYFAQLVSSVMRADKTKKSKQLISATLRQNLSIFGTKHITSMILEDNFNVWSLEVL